MKKLVLLSFLAISAVVSNAQSLAIIEPVNIVTGTVAELGTTGELVAAWDVQNISNNFLEVRASRNVISQVDGSSNYFCWGVCFGAETNISPISTNQDMDGGEVNNTFYAHYISAGNAGVTEVEYCFFDAANPTDRTCQSVQYCVDAECFVGVENPTSEIEFSELYPNPLVGLGSIKYHFHNTPSSDTKLVIYNMVGKVVQETRISSKDGILLINGQDFESGIYLYSLITNGKTEFTKRIVVAK